MCWLAWAHSDVALPANFTDELLSGRIISVNIDSIAKEPALQYLRKGLARSR
jgi:hypothetical protein